MPLVEIRLLNGRTSDQKKALLKSVTEAIHSSIDAPLPTIRVWIHEIPSDEYMVGGQLASERRR